MIYQHPALALRSFPTIIEALTAIRNAELPGNSKDVRLLQAILSRISVASPRLAGHILTRKTAISSFDWNITSDSAAGQDDLVEKRLKKTISAILSGVVNEQLFGTFALRLSWNPNETKEIVPSVDYVYHPTELEKDGNVLNILEGNDLTRFTRKTATDSPNIVFGVDQGYWIGGLLRSIVFHEILRNDNLQEWANFNKKLKGIIQGKAPSDEMKDAGNALKNMIGNNYAITSKDVEFIFNEMTSAKGTDSFDRFKKTLEDDVAIAILGQANTAQLPNNGGSRASLQVLNLIRTDILFADMLRAKEIINDQLLLTDYRLNTKKNATSTPYKFDFVFDEVNDVEGNARMIEIADRIGVEMKKEEVYAKLGFSVPSGDDEIFSSKPSTGGIPFPPNNDSTAPTDIPMMKIDNQGGRTK
jgi:phage gp29-like protein